MSEEQQRHGMTFEGSGPFDPSITYDWVRRMFMIHLRESRAHFGNKFRKAMTAAYDSYCGETLTDLERRWTDDQGIEGFGIKTIGRSVNTLTGIDAGASYPQWSADSGRSLKAVAEMLTDLFQRTAHSSKYFSSFFAAAMDRNIAGYGHLSFEEASRGGYRSIKYRSPRPWEVWLDPLATEINLGDARFIITRRVAFRKAIEARFPRIKDLLSVMSGSGQTIPVDVVNVNLMDSADDLAAAQGEDKAYYIYTYCFRISERRKVIRFSNGVRTAVPPSQVDQATAAAEGAVDAQGQPVTASQGMDEFASAYYEATVVASEDGQGAIPASIKRLKHDCHSTLTMTGYPEHLMGEKKVHYFGEPRLTLQLERTANRALRVLVDSVARAGSGGGFVNLDAIPGARDPWLKEQSIPGIFSVVKWTEHRDLGPAIIPRPESRTPAGMDQLVETLISISERNKNVSPVLAGGFRTDRTTSTVVNQASEGAAHPISPLIFARESFVRQVGAATFALVRGWDPEDVYRVVPRESFGDFDPHRLLQMMSPETLGVRVAGGEDPTTDAAAIQAMSQLGVPAMIQQSGGDMAGLINIFIEMLGVSEGAKKKFEEYFKAAASQPPPPPPPPQEGLPS